MRRGARCSPQARHRVTHSVVPDDRHGRPPASPSVNRFPPPTPRSPREGLALRIFFGSGRTVGVAVVHELGGLRALLLHRGGLREGVTGTADLRASLGLATPHRARWRGSRRATPRRGGTGPPGARGGSRPAYRSSARVFECGAERVFVRRFSRTWAVCTLFQIADSSVAAGASAHDEKAGCARVGVGAAPRARVEQRVRRRDARDPWYRRGRRERPGIPSAPPGGAEDVEPIVVEVTESAPEDA